MTAKEFTEMISKSSGSDGKLLIVVQNDDRLLTAKEVAEKWSCDPNLVRDYQKKGLLRGICFKGRRIQYRQSEVEAFEVWAEGKDLNDLDHIIDTYTGEEVPHRFAGMAEILTVPKQA